MAQNQKMTESERMVWAAAFSAALEAGRGETAAAHKAAHAVTSLREVNRVMLDSDALVMLDTMRANPEDGIARRPLGG